MAETGYSVAVLLSAFNGEKFIAQQIDSILAQSFEHLQIIVRDDGSTDATLDVLKIYRKNPRVSIVEGKNLGAAKGFLSLLSLTDNCDFYAFADQDDVWCIDKIEKGVASLLQVSNEEVPALYCSNVAVVDEHLVEKKLRARMPYKLKFENAVIQCPILGCTMILNAQARNLIVGAGLPANPIMHDWWCYLVLSAFGQVVYDPCPHIKYRQHAENIYGHPGMISSLKVNMKALLSGDKIQQARRQALDFLYLHQENVSEYRRAEIRNFTDPNASLLDRLVFSLKFPYYKQHWLGSLAARASASLNGA
jgi:glycosyltransferase involved in cell wall biosynthesis